MSCEFCPMAGGGCIVCRPSADASERTQLDLSRRSGVGQSTISSIRTGERSDLRAEVVARLG